MRKPLNKNPRTLTPEQIARLKENAVGILANGRKTILARFPFVGSIAMSLDLVPTRDCRNTTMCTDGSAIYCDIDFLNGLSTDDMMFIVAHEIYHNVMLHTLRQDNRDHDTFNIATDIEVNTILEDDGMLVPKMVLTAENQNVPRGISAEAIYDLLIERKKNNNKLSPNSPDAGNESSQSTSGNPAGILAGQFDRHVSKGEKLEEKGDESLQDSYGEVGYDTDFRPNVTASAAEHIREAAIAAAQNIERQGGTLPNHIKSLVNSLLAPKLNWKDLLAKFVTKSTGMNRTWNRPNRRFMNRGIYLPSTYGEKMKVAVGIDTSASVQQYVERFMSEINGLIKSFGEYELTIIQCDTQVQKVDMYTNEDPLDLEHTKYELNGFGGTILDPIFKHVKENNIDVDCIVVLTDGFLADKFTAKDTPELPVLWCVTKNGSKTALTFGEIADIDD